MERPVVFPWFPFLLFMWLSAASAQNEVVYVKLGGTINLKPDSSGPFTNILWKHKGRLVVKWMDNDLDYYGKFVGRTTLNTTTGGLVIEDTAEAFAGLYTVETNSQVQAKGYKVEFMKSVTEPEVVAWACLIELEACTLVCLHHGASGVGPLTYSWREDGGDWRQGGKEKRIVNDVKTQGIETFSCRVENQVSEAESDPYNNPLYDPDLDEPSWSTDLAVGFAVFFALMLLALRVANFFNRNWTILSRPYQTLSQ